MNETYIQTIRGGIQRVIHLAKDHWTQEPKRCGFNYHHELYGYIPVRKPSKLSGKPGTKHGRNTLGSATRTAT